MKVRQVIYADKGKILTNGEIYGKQIFLAEGVSSFTFYEIPEEEYIEKMKQEESVNVSN